MNYELGAGDIVRHERHGLGVVREVQPGALRIAYVDGVRRHRVAPPDLLSRDAVIALVERHGFASDNLNRGLFLWLRSKELDLWLHAAIYFASRSSRVESFLRESLAGIAPSRRDRLRDRLVVGRKVHDELCRRELPMSMLHDVYNARESKVGVYRGPYANHCWSCHATVDASDNEACRGCGWLVCDCGACRDPRQGECTVGARRRAGGADSEWRSWYR